MAKLLTVSQLNEYVKGVFEDELVLQNLYVTGEIFEFSRRANGTYLTLRDEGAQISCVRFAAVEPFRPGEKVKLYGGIRYSAKAGKLSFVFKTIERLGDGELHARFLQLKTQLEQEGLFARKPPLPRVIARIAVITSGTGAVIRDLLSTVHAHRDFGEVSLFSVRVQGEGAEDDLLNALGKVNESGSFDAAVLARGGGSSSDLQAFNGERLARAVAASKTPVISAVGHETDFTLCDFCAAARAGTPSIAGEMIAGINEAFFARLCVAAEGLNKAAARAVASRLERLRRAQQALSLQIGNKTEVTQTRLKLLVPALNKAMCSRLSATAGIITAAAGGLNDAMHNRIEQRRLRTEAADKQLAALSPVKLLAGGYAKVYRGSSPVNSIKNLRDDDEIELYMADGKALATVKKTELY